MIEIRQPMYGPSVVEELSEVSAETQRDWRRRGLIDGFGTQSGNGRWQYSFLDIVAFYTARRLMRADMDRAGATSMGWSCAGGVADYLMGRPATYRYAGMSLRGGGPTEHDPDLHKLDFDMHAALSLEEVLDKPFDRLELIDLKRLADTAPDALKVAARKIQAGVAI